MTTAWLWLIVGAVVGAIVPFIVMSRQLAAGRGREEKLDQSLTKAKEEGAEFRRRAHEGKETIKGLRDSATAGDRAVLALEQARADHAAALEEQAATLDLRERMIANLRLEVDEREHALAELKAKKPKARAAEARDDANGQSPARSSAPMQAPAAAPNGEATRPHDAGTPDAGGGDSEATAERAAKSAKQSEKAAAKAKSLETDLEASRETNRVLNQRATELKAAVNRLEQKFLERNRRIRDLEQELEARSDLGALVTPAQPAEGLAPDDEKMANERLVNAYHRDMRSRDTQISDLRKQISQRDRKISQLLESPGGDGSEDADSSSSEGAGSDGRGKSAKKSRAGRQDSADTGEAAAAAEPASTTEDEGHSSSAAESSSDPSDATAKATTAGTADSSKAKGAATAGSHEATEAAAAGSSKAAKAATDDTSMAKKAATVSSSDSKNAVTADASPSPEGAVDDLTRITGIGPVFQRRLNAKGIYHFAALAELEADAVKEAVEAKDWQAADIPKWLDQARGFAGADAQ